MSTQLHHGDALTVLGTLPEASVNCCVSSPPYWGLRDYGVDGQIGLEETPELYVSKLVAVFSEVRRVLRDDGTLWLNVGDSYNAGTAADRQTSKTSVGDGKHGYWTNPNINKRCNAPGLKTKDMVGVPWMLAFALRADGWYLRSEIIWHKPNPMPESVTDRPTKAHEQIFLLAKSERYYYDSEAISEIAVNGELFHGDYGKPGVLRGTAKRNGRPSAARGSFNGKTEAMSESGRNAFRAITETRNKRSVWTVNTKPFLGAHFATFPEALIKPCILAGCPAGGTVLDPFSGAATTGLVAKEHGRNYIGIELNAEYIRISEKRLSQEVLDFQESPVA